MALSLTVIFCSDGEPWLDYVKNWLDHNIPGIQIDSINLEMQDWSTLTKSDFLLVIMTPTFVDYLSSDCTFRDIHHTVAPSKTFGLYCGVEESALSEVAWDDFYEWTFSSLSSEQDVLQDTMERLKKFLQKPVKKTSVPKMAPVVQPNPMMGGMGGMAQELAQLFQKRNKEQHVASDIIQEESSAVEQTVVDSSPSQSIESDASGSVGVEAQHTPKTTRFDRKQETPDSGLKTQERPPFVVGKPKSTVHVPFKSTKSSSYEDNSDVPPPEEAKDMLDSDTGMSDPFPSTKSEPVVSNSDSCDEAEPHQDSTLCSTENTYDNKESEKKSRKFILVPKKVQYKDEIFIILSEGSSEPRLSVKIENRKHDQRDGKFAERHLNDHTFSFAFECDDMCTGDVHITVFETRSKCLGRKVIKYVSKRDVMCTILPTFSSPIEMMSDILGLDSSNTAALDQHFTRSYYENNPRQYGPFYNFASDTTVEKSDKRIPTLLHFAAKYGLLELAKLLITFPSASLAYRIDNCDGCSPKDIAEKEQHHDLIKFFARYEIAIMQYETNCVIESVYEMYDVDDGQRNSGFDESELYLSMEECYRTNYPVASEDLYNYSPYLPKYGASKPLQIVMKEGEDSNSDDGPNLPEPIDDFHDMNIAANDSDGDYLDLVKAEPSQYRMEGPKVPSTGARVPPPVAKHKPPPPPPPRPPPRCGMSPQSFLAAPVADTVGSQGDSSMRDLLLMIEEYKKGMFNQTQTLTRFDDWQKKHEKGTNETFKTKLSMLEKMRLKFAKTKGNIEIVHHPVDQSLKSNVVKEERPPEPPPRLDFRRPYVPNKPRSRAGSSRSASTVSSGSSRASNLSVTSMHDSGHGGEEEIYEDFGDTCGSVSNVKTTPNVYSASPGRDGPAPPPPPRIRSACPPLPSRPGFPPAPPHLQATCSIDEEDERRTISSLGHAPPVPPKKF